MRREIQEVTSNTINQYMSWLVRKWQVFPKKEQRKQGGEEAESWRGDRSVKFMLDFIEKLTAEQRLEKMEN